jgi:tetratricopeptide (TPR) repeat protein
VAVVLSLFVGLPSTAIITLSSRRSLRDIARTKLERLRDDAEFYRIQRSSSHWFDDPRHDMVSFEPIEPSNPSSVEAAVRALKYYAVLEPGDWRQRDEVRFLPQADREELELWMMEQAFRYCFALCDRPDSREDWQRARNALAYLGKLTPIPAFALLGERLDRKLGITTSSSSSASGSVARSVDSRRSAQAFSPWLSEYLMGVAAEYDLDASHGSPTNVTVNDSGLTVSSEPGHTQPHVRVRRNATRALAHYRKLLALRPDSYWGHYRAAGACYALGSFADRAAGACYALGSFAETSEHLERCLAIRPNNPVIHGYRAACLAWLERYSEALEECDQAISGAPDLAELVRTRAFIRVASGQRNGLKADLQRFELLGQFLPRRFLGRSLKPDPLDAESARGAIETRRSEIPNALDMANRFSSALSLFAGPNETLAVDPAELRTRITLASSIRQAGESDVASAENAKILVLDPDFIPARLARAIEEFELRRFNEGQRDLSAVLDHPALIEYLRKDPTLLRCFHQISHLLSNSGKAHEGQVLARKALDLANSLHQLRGESHYSLAQAYSVLARTDQQFVGQAAEELWWVFVANPVNQGRYLQDIAFDPVREQIDAGLRSKPSPAAEHARLVNTPLARAH